MFSLSSVKFFFVLLKVGLGTVPLLLSHILLVLKE
jgi:hypothetical protein